MRDVLIALLVIGIALNVAVLLVAIMARPRPVSTDAPTGQPPALSPAEPGGVLASPTTAGVTPRETYLSTEPAVAQAAEAVAGPGLGFHATTTSTTTSVLAAAPAAGELTVGPPDGVTSDATSAGTHRSGEPLAPTQSSAPDSADTTGRRRRFVLPRLEEDRARSDRAIAAVLGEVDTSGAARPAVRRQRTRRPAGEPVQHTEVRLVGSTGYGADFTYALARAMEQTTRDTDRVQVLPEGSVRLLLEADDVGAGAFVGRARALLAPWLQFAGVSVEFLVRPLPTGEPAVPAVERTASPR